MSLPSTLKPGARLGPYEVIALIGAGGMGEVYRARDTRLGRLVAVKVLHPEFADDPERRRRFEREARAIAVLSHPQVCVVHDVGREGDTDYLVMELLEGETLAAHLTRLKGPLPLDRVLSIGAEAAAALEKAHGAGIVHRDLKPANVMLTKTGAKLLDFGLVKLQGPAVALSSARTTSSRATAHGTILGTLHYMAPEQVEGREVDARSDIWALGVVIYEMATGVRPFEGESAASVISAILKDTPATISSRRPLTPVALEHVVERCLDKEPDERWQTAGDVKRELAWIASLPAEIVNPPADGQRSRQPWPLVLPWGVAAIAVAIAVAALAHPGRVPTKATERLVQVDARISGDVSLDANQGPAAVLSPDGSLIAFIARRPGQARQLYVRRLDQLDMTPLVGTEGASIPFFSPDGQWLAFFADGKLKKLPVSGGPPVVVCDAPSARGGSWGDDGWIAFTPNSSGSVSLLRVSAAGGRPQPLIALGGGEVTQRWPQILPGSRSVLYTTSSNLGSYNDGEIVIQPLPSGLRKTVVSGGYFGRYVPSGHLTYLHDGRLFAAPFDVDRLAITGEAVPILESVSRIITTGAGQFTVSDTGTAAYIPGDLSAARPLQWLERAAAPVPLMPNPADWSNPRVSPDGDRIALDIYDGRQTDIWVYEWARRNALTRLTFDPSEDWMPLWTPDGTRIVFRSSRDRAFNLYWQRADGSATAARLTTSSNPQVPTSWHVSGKVLAFSEQNPLTNSDIMLLPFDAAGAAGTPVAFLNTTAAESGAAFSPDGKWIAYVSDESGRSGVYVRPYPGPGGQWLVAPEGGEPTWSRARAELLFVGPDQKLMVSSFTTNGTSFQPDAPRPWAPSRLIPRPRGLAGSDGRGFDLHPDGVRAVGAWASDTEPVLPQNRMVLIFHFFDELRRVAPGGRLSLQFVNV